MELNNSYTIREVKEVFNLYEIALVTNNIKALDQFFHQSKETVRFGVSENLFGYESISEFRKTRPAENLNRYLSKTTISTFDRHFATITTLFHKKNMAIGRQSQTWVKFPEGWKIVSAHVSYANEKDK